jgi:hypothetical protein
VPKLGKTTAELAPEQKNQISHRGRAARLAREVLQDWPTSSSPPEQASQPHLDSTRDVRND